MDELARKRSDQADVPTLFYESSSFVPVSESDRYCEIIGELIYESRVAFCPLLRRRPHLRPLGDVSEEVRQWWNIWWECSRLSL